MLEEATCSFFTDMLLLVATRSPSPSVNTFVQSQRTYSSGLFVDPRLPREAAFSAQNTSMSLSSRRISSSLCVVLRPQLCFGPVAWSELPCTASDVRAIGPYLEQCFLPFFDPLQANKGLTAYETTVWNAAAKQPAWWTCVRGWCHFSTAVTGIAVP